MFLLLGKVVGSGYEWLTTEVTFEKKKKRDDGSD